MSEEALKECLAALRSGDKVAFEELYQEFKTPVYTIIFRIVYDRALTEDLLQELFLRLFRAPPDSRVRHPRAFIFQMARNLAIDSKRRPAPVALPAALEAGGCLLEERAVLSLGIEKAMQALPGGDREVVTLRINAGLKFKEIASLLHIPLGTALWKYHRALRRLRSELSGGE